MAHLDAQVVKMRAELAIVTEERDALRGQLRDFVVSIWCQYIHGKYGKVKCTSAFSQVPHRNKLNGIYFAVIQIGYKSRE